jgi:hypothetical protein
MDKLKKIKKKKKKKLLMHKMLGNMEKVFKKNQVTL